MAISVHLKTYLILRCVISVSCWRFALSHCTRVRAEALITSTVIDWNLWYHGGRFFDIYQNFGIRMSYHHLGCSFLLLRECVQSSNNSHQTAVCACSHGRKVTWQYKHARKSLTKLFPPNSFMQNFTGWTSKCPKSQGSRLFSAAHANWSGGKLASEHENFGSCERRWPGNPTAGPWKLAANLPMEWKVLSSEKTSHSVLHIGIKTLWSFNALAACCDMKHRILAHVLNTVIAHTRDMSAKKCSETATLPVLHSFTFPSSTNSTSFLSCPFFLLPFPDSPFLFFLKTKECRAVELSKRPSTISS